MPLHPIGLIFGGALAVIGSGYAFKKLVYDPHLAPYVEAFLLSHPLHSFLPSPTPLSEQHQYSTAHGLRRQAVPVPVPAWATATGRQPNLTKLRRRSNRLSRGEEERKAMDMEEKESLLHGRDRFQEEASEKGDHQAASFTWGGAIRRVTGQVEQAAERVSDVLSGANEKQGVPRKRRSSDLQPLINLDDDPASTSATEQHSSPQEAEIRSVIFNYTTPEGSGSRTPIGRADVSHRAQDLPPAYQHGMESRHTEPNGGGLGESTTFSFLSLSQASSPEMANKDLSGSCTFGRAGGTLESGQHLASSSGASPVAASSAVPTPSPRRSGWASPASVARIERPLSAASSVIMVHPVDVHDDTNVDASTSSLTAESLQSLSSPHSISDSSSRRTGWEYIHTSTSRSPSNASPFPSHSQSPDHTPAFAHAGGDSGALEIDQLGMSFLRSPGGMSAFSELRDASPGPEVGGIASPRRGPMSVVSLSDSEGWEAV